MALGRQRELILTNALGLLGIALFAALLIGPFGAQGGAAGAPALAVPNLLGLAAAALAAAVFLSVGQTVGMVPEDLHEAMGLRRLLGPQTVARRRQPRA